MNDNNDKKNGNVPQFSLFAPGINKPRGQKPYLTEATMSDVYRWMNSMNMMKLTQQLRAITDEKEQKRFKAEKLPFATFSGTFSYRNQKGLLKHSSLQCFDFDHLGSNDEINRVRQLLANDPYFSTELMFTSPRGDGLKWVTRIDLERATHEKWYAAIRRYLQRQYSLNADPMPGNVASACFLCFDAQMTVNTDVAPF